MKEMKFRKNPFVVGKVVSGESFADRKELLSELLLDVVSGQNIIVFGPRRLGKTSLVKELLRQTKEKYDVQPIYIDLLRYDTAEQVAGQIFHQIAGTIDKAIELARAVIRGVSIRLNESNIELVLTPPSDLLTKIFDYLGTKAAEGNRIIVVLDEFQEMEAIAPNKIRTIRSIIQHHENVSYIFTGSKQSIMQFFTRSNHPFYKFGKLIHVDKPEEKEMMAFIEESFLKSGIHISSEPATQIIQLTSNLPYFTQMLAHETWNVAVLNEIGEVSKTIVENAFETISNRLRVEHETTWSNLTRNQRIACKILVQHVNPYQQQALRKYHISQSSLQQSIKSLIEKQVIWKKDGHFEFLDPFFHHWLKKRL